jgi:uncharacterized protein YuzE
MEEQVAVPVKVTIDRFADAAKIRLGPGTAVPGASRELAPGVLFDFDENGQVVSIEVLGLKRRGIDLRNVDVEMNGLEDAESLSEDHPGTRAFARALEDESTAGGEL